MKPLSSASPHAIIMVGIPGSGKSTFAEQFAETFQAPIINQRKLQHEFELDDEAAADLAHIILKEYLKTHRTVVVDADASTRDQRADLVKLFKKAGYKTLFVWVQTDTNESIRRAAKPYPQGSGITEEAFDAALDAFEAPIAKERIASIVVSGKHTYVTQLRAVLKQLAAANPPSNPPTTQATRTPSPAPTSPSDPQAPAAPTQHRPHTRGITVR